MLDVSIRAGVLNLMRQFRDDLGISFVYVSHDLPTIRYVADRTAIMYLGQVVEIGPTETVIRERRHPYTQLLIDASPEPDPEVVKPPMEAAGEIPSAIDLPNGCRFHTRCPLATSRCGWEARDVISALSDVVIRDKSDGEAQAAALGTVARNGLDLNVSAPLGAVAARNALVAAMSAKHPALPEAAMIEESPSGLTVRFAPIEPPNPRDLGGGYHAACILLDPVV